MAENIERKNLSVSNKSRVSESVSYYVDQLAMGLGTFMAPERTVIYIRALSGLTGEQLAHGFDKALKLFKPEYGQNFPAPAQLIEWAHQWRPPIDTTKEILGRGDKPPGWEPVEPGELDRLVDEIKAEAERKAIQ